MRGAPILLLAALLVSGCGFHPLYAVPGETHGEMRADLGAIYVEPLPDKLGYELRNRLIDVLDAKAEMAGARYRLHVSMNEKNEAIGVQSQQVGNISQTAITRYNDTLTVQYELVDLATGKAVTHGTESGLSAYNVLASPYATLIAQQDADKRAADDIAERIRLALAVYFAQGPKAP